jgi:hypothetical protein
MHRGPGDGARPARSGRLVAARAAPAASPPTPSLPCRLGELNASCVGFSTHLELADTIAQRAITSVLAAKVGAGAWPAAAAPRRRNCLPADADLLQPPAR